MPPILKTVHHDPRTSAGCLFLAPLSGPGQRGSLLLDRDGEPLWFKPSKPVVALNFRAAVYRGKPVLTWWEGKTERGLGDGTHVILDQSYREVARHPGRRRAGRPTCTSSCSRSRGTALVTSWERAPMDLSSIGGPSNGVVVGGIVQELELPSGRVLFEWRSLDHVASRRVTLGRQHERRVRLLPHQLDRARRATATCSSRPATPGRSTRSTGAAGNIIWRLGGKKQRLRDGAWHRIRLAARRAPSRRERSAGQPVRRRRRAAGSAAVEERSCLRSTRSECGRRSHGSTPTPRRCSPTRSAARSCSRTATCSSAGAPRRGFSEYTRRRRARVRRAPAARRAELPRA